MSDTLAVGLFAGLLAAQVLIARRNEEQMAKTRAEVKAAIDQMAQTAAEEHGEVVSAIGTLTSTVDALTARIAELEGAQDFQEEFDAVTAANDAVKAIFTPTP